MIDCKMCSCLPKTGGLKSLDALVRICEHLKLRRKEAVEKILQKVMKVEKRENEPIIKIYI